MSMLAGKGGAIATALTRFRLQTLLQKHETKRASGKRAAPLNHAATRNWPLWIKAGIAAVAFMFAYLESVASMIGMWLREDGYSHCIIVPFVCIYFIWLGRENLRNTPVQSNLIGGLLVVSLGSFFLLAGRIGSAQTLEYLALVMIIPGVLLALAGLKYLMALALPMTYMIFMVPLDVFTEKAQWPLQLASARLGAAMLGGIGVPVHLKSNYLELPARTLEVAPECSGISYLISIIAIAIPVAYFTQRTALRRGALLSAAILIGLVANGLRIALIGGWTYYGGNDSLDALHGPGHIFQGFFVSIIGYIILFTYAWLSGGGFGSDAGHAQAAKRIPAASPAFDARRFNIAWMITVMALVAAGGYLRAHAMTQVPPAKNFAQAPLRMGEWTAENMNHHDPLAITEGADYKLARIYRDKSGNKALLYIWYYASQGEGREITNPGMRKLFNRTTGEINIESGAGENMAVNKTVVNADGYTYAALFWYVVDGEVMADRRSAKLRTIYNGLFHGRADGAVVAILGEADDASSIDSVAAAITQFAAIAADELTEYFPARKTREDK